MDRRSRRELVEKLGHAAEQLGAHFGLRFRAVEAERANVRSRYGVCYSDGTIRIRLQHATTGRPLKYSSLVNTLCHELAHLRHFDHGPRFRRFYLEILAHARAMGIYRPGRSARSLAPSSGSPRRVPAVYGPDHRREDVARPSGPVQLVLFGEP